MSNPLEDIMGGIVAAADKEMKQTVLYKELSANSSDGVGKILEIYDMASSEVSMTMTSVVKEKYGIKRMDDELYWFIREFPVAIDKLSKEIERTEGHVCCVDKAWSRHLAKFNELVAANQDGEQS